MSDLAFAEAFLERFVLPLVVGSEVHVGAPLGLRGAVRLRQAIVHKLDDTEVGAALQEARAVQLRSLGFSGPPLELGDDLAALPWLAALHDLLFLLHPEAVRWSLEDRVSVLHTAQELCRLAALDPADTSVEILYGRHSLGGSLWLLGRDDVRRQTRRGVQVYKGRKAPRRWLAGDDEDDEVQRVAVLPELFGLPKDLGRDVVRALFAGSPLSDLYHPLRPAPSPPLELLAHAGWLRFPEVARLLVRRYCELGLFTVGPLLSAALLGDLDGGSAKATSTGAGPSAERTAWLSFASHLHLVAHVLVESPLPVESAAPATIDFYALYAALHTTRPALAMPADVSSDPSLRAAAARHAQRCRSLAGPARVNKLSSLFGKPHVEAA